MQSGFPFTPQLSYNPANNGDSRNPVRPFLNPAFTGPVVTGNPNQWFNPNAFIAPPSNSGFYGNVGRDTYTGPGLATWDFSAFKDTHVSERMNLQFRAEIFNLLNRANFNTPNLIARCVASPAERDLSRAIAHGGAGYEHLDHVEAGSVRVEAALVKYLIVSATSAGLQDLRDPKNQT